MSVASVMTWSKTRVKLLEGSTGIHWIQVPAARQGTHVEGLQRPLVAAEGTGPPTGPTLLLGPVRPVKSSVHIIGSTRPKDPVYGAASSPRAHHGNTCTEARTWRLGAVASVSGAAAVAAGALAAVAVSARGGAEDNTNNQQQSRTQGLLPGVHGEGIPASPWRPAPPEGEESGGLCSGATAAQSSGRV